MGAAVALILGEFGATVHTVDLKKPSVPHASFHVTDLSKPEQAWPLVLLNRPLNNVVTGSRRIEHRAEKIVGLGHKASSTDAWLCWIASKRQIN